MVKKPIKKKRPSLAKNRPPSKDIEIRPHARPIEWTNKLIENEAEELLKWCKDPNNYYFIKFFNERGYVYEQAERFARSNDTFCKALSHARSVQEQRLVELAVTKKGDGNFIKFILQNKAGWKEKSEVSGDGNNPLTVILDKIGATHKEPIEEAEVE